MRDCSKRAVASLKRAARCATSGLESSATAPDLPPGASLWTSFVSRREHDKLVSTVDSARWQDPHESGISRRTQQYGWQYQYCTAGGDYSESAKGTELNLHLGDLPEWLNVLVERAADRGITCARFNQVSINEYVDGRGIGQHVDTVNGFEGPVASLSLLSHVALTLKKNGTRDSEDGQERTVVLPPCSLLLLDGESRYHWSHGIKSKNRKKKEDVVNGIVYPRARRIAVTFRVVSLQEANA